MTSTSDVITVEPRAKPRLLVTPRPLVPGDQYARAVRDGSMDMGVPLLAVCRSLQAINVPLAMRHAPGGLVEAFEITGAPAFAYAVQWHPAWRWSETPFYTAIFAAFGAARKSLPTYRSKCLWLMSKKSR